MDPTVVASPKLITLAGTSSLTQVSLSDPNTNEDWLQQQIHEYPDLLPIDEIGTAWGPLVSLGREIPVAAGAIDNLLLSPAGELTVVETKLWRNPEARRKVIGQILDYASALAELSYEELDEAVRVASPGDDRTMWERVVGSAYAPSIDTEHGFVNTVTRNLKMGSFLLLVVGDGIRSDLHGIASLLGSQPSLGFHLELVEVRLYRMPDGALLVVPNLVGRTQEVTRAVVQIHNPERADVSVTVEVPQTDQPPGRGRFDSVDEFVANAAESIGDDRAAAIEGVIEWWQKERAGVVTLNKTSVNLAVPYRHCPSGRVSVMTVYVNGRVEGSVAPMAEWRGLLPADEALARFQAAGFEGDPSWPRCDPDFTHPAERQRLEQLLIWADELIRDAE